MHKPQTTAPQEAPMFTFATFADAEAFDAACYTESPTEREEREATMAGQPPLTDSEVVARDDEAALDLEEWWSEYRNGFASRPPWA